MDITLTATLGIIQLFLAGLGIYVSIKPQPNKRHKYLIITFTVSGFLGIASSVGLQYLNKKDSATQQNTLNYSLAEQKDITKQLQGDLYQSHLSQEFMKGQLTSISMISAKISQTVSDPGLRQMAKAMEKIAQSSSQAKSTDDKQVCARTMDLVKRFGEFEHKKRLSEGQSKEQWQQKLKIAKTDAEQNDIWQKMTMQNMKEHDHFQYEFRTTLLGESVYLKDELLKRLPSQPKPDRDLIALEGFLAGPAPISDAAAYLESLSRKLCP